MRTPRRGGYERQLTHGERNKVSAAYNFAEYLPERRKMMQTWADYLDKLRISAAELLRGRVDSWTITLLSESGAELGARARAEAMGRTPAR